MGESRNSADPQLQPGIAETTLAVDITPHVYPTTIRFNSSLF
jgi:hypothetical protein